MKRDRLAPVLAIVGGAIVLVVALVVASQISNKKNPNTSNLNMVSSINEMLQGIPQKGIYLGNPKAKLTLIEFADPQCSACASFSENSLPELIQNYVRTGKVRIEYQGQTFVDRYAKGSSDSNRLLRMALAAGEQRKLWDFVEIVYANQGAEDSGYATDSYLKEVAGAIPGLDVNKAFALASPTSSFAAQIKASANRFNSERFGGTPSFMVGPTGGKAQKVSEADLDSRIDAQLKK